MELMAVYQHLWVTAVSEVEKSQAGQIQAWVSRHPNWSMSLTCRA